MTTRNEQIFGVFYLALGCGLVVWAAAMGEWLVAANAGVLWPLVYGAARKIQQLEEKVQQRPTMEDIVRRIEENHEGAARRVGQAITPAWLQQSQGRH